LCLITFCLRPFAKQIIELTHALLDNYVTSAALDIGLALCALAIFFSVQLPGASMPVWWGVNITMNTLDQEGAAVRQTVPEGQIFGPPAGSWKW